MEPPRTNLRRSGRWWIVGALAALAAGGYAAVRLRDAAHAPPPGAPLTPAPAAPAAAEPGRMPAPAAPTAAEPPATVEEAPALLAGASADPLFREWLAHGDPIHRWAVITDNLAEGVSPRKALAFLAPRAPFSVTPGGDGLAISTESFSRYDAIADAIGSVDVHALATAYRRLHGVVEAAYRALGFPDGSLDRATARALRRLEDAPVASDEMRVVNQGGVYVFADPALERLGDVEKHLLRMGPRNERILQAKAREIAQALQLPAVASAGVSR